MFAAERPQILLSVKLKAPQQCEEYWSRKSGLMKQTTKDGVESARREKFLKWPERNTY